MKLYTSLRSIFLVSLLLSGCAHQQLVFDTQCNVAGSTLIESVTLLPSNAEQVVRYNPPAGGSTCVQLTRLPPDRNAPSETRAEMLSAGDDTGAIELKLGPEPTLRALNGGGAVSEISFSADAWRNDEIYFWQATDGSAEALRTRNPRFGFRVDIFFNPDLVNPDRPRDPPSEFVDVPLPEMECIGRLKGFRPVFEYSDAPSAYPQLHRSDVGVRCSASYVVFPSPTLSQSITVTSGFTWADEQGRYQVTIPATTWRALKSIDPPRLVSVAAACLSPEQCGHEAGGLDIQTRLDTPVPGLVAPLIFNVDIANVLDIVSQGPFVTSTEGVVGPQLMLGARLISSATTLPERNDKPFIIHEQLDVFNVEHTNFLLWGFAGQPVKTTYRLNGRRVDSNPRTEPCEIDAHRQYCVPFSEDCNPNTCSAADRDCLEYPLLLTLLEAGYDVWLVDHLRGEEDIAHIAAAAPLLYQRILNYGAADGLLPSLPAFDTGRFATYSHNPKVLTPKRALADLEQHLLLAEPPPVPPVPASGARRAVVSGFSLGGVVSRLGLRLWELADLLPESELVDASGEAVKLASSSTVFLERPEKKIALYVSLDAPHRGVKIPPALQAYIKRVGAVANTLDELSGSDKAQINRAVAELEAIPTRQLLQQEIDKDTDKSLGCWKGGKDPDVSTCRVQPFGNRVPDRVGNEISTWFLDKWTNKINAKEPASFDGLPATIPSIAISNGNVGDRRSLDALPSAEAVHLKFDINNWDDRHHSVCDEFDENAHQGISFPGLDFGTCGQAPEQAAGSQWNNACARLGNINTSAPITGFILKEWLAAMLHINLRGIKITYPMQAKFDNNGDPIPGTGFPTIVPTDSSLLQQVNGRPSAKWRDALWQSQSEYHPNVDERMCRMILFHADGAFDDDKDGWPACTRNMETLACNQGGRSPGQVLGTRPLDPNLAPCDCRPGDSSSYPGAFENFRDRIDNDCDGEIDEQEVQPF